MKRRNELGPEIKAGEITPRELLACFDPSRLVGVREVRLPA